MTNLNDIIHSYTSESVWSVTTTYYIQHNQYVCASLHNYFLFLTPILQKKKKTNERITNSFARMNFSTFKYIIKTLKLLLSSPLLAIESRFSVTGYWMLLIQWYRKLAPKSRRSLIYRLHEINAINAITKHKFESPKLMVRDMESIALVSSFYGQL